MATVKTLGQVKVEALRARLLEINPDACIEMMKATYAYAVHPKQVLADAILGDIPIHPMPP